VKIFKQGNRAKRTRVRRKAAHYAKAPIGTPAKIIPNNGYPTTRVEKAQAKAHAQAAILAAKLAAKTAPAEPATKPAWTIAGRSDGRNRRGKPIGRTWAQMYGPDSTR
jgi:hypothetical protein